MSSTSTNLASDSWAIADLLRGDFTQSQYGRIILQFALLRRLECVLEESEEAVLAQVKKVEAAEQLLIRVRGPMERFQIFCLHSRRHTNTIINATR